MDSVPFLAPGMKSVSVADVAAYAELPYEMVDAATQGHSGRLSAERLSVKAALSALTRLQHAGKLTGSVPYRSFNLTAPVKLSLDEDGNASERFRQALAFAVELATTTDLLAYTRPFPFEGRTRQKILQKFPRVVDAKLRVIAHCCATADADAACWAVQLYLNNIKRLQRSQE